VCIVGEPNVGKSTLLNVILNEDKAIVSEIPGTTRDIIEDSLVINGVAFRFIDTAGIRETSDTIERMGIDRTFQKIEQASFVLLLVDATAPLQSIKNHIKEIKTRISATQKIIVVINKIDVATDLQLEQHCNDMLSEHLSEQDSIVCISAKKKQNIQQLIDILVGDVQYDTISQHDAIVTNIRHFEALQHAHTALEHVLHGLETKLSNDLVSLELRQVLHHIGSITGNISNDEMLGHIFENFCIGK
jgi:tRNA modification GTPase